MRGITVVFAALAVGGVGLVACGDDDGGGGGLDQAYCQARIDIEAAFFAGPPDEAALDDALTALEDNAPSDLEDQTSLVVDSVREEGPEAFEDEDVAAAGNEVSEAVYDDCGYEQVDVTGLDYSFEGIPSEVSAGDVAFRFTNDGDEPHEMTIFRIDDDADESLDEIVQLSGREARELITVTGGTAAEPSGTDYTIGNLEPGRYGAVCFIETPEGVPHVEEGMLFEFEVT
jgi:hypothetical protein